MARNESKKAKGQKSGALKPKTEVLSKDLVKESNDSNLPVPTGTLAPVPAGASDPLSVYVREIAKTPLLTPKEERELAIKVFDLKDQVAFQKLVQSNLRFVVKIAFEYARYGARILDLIQEGNVGLLKAVQDFNPYRDVRLTTYAVWWIRSYIQDFLLRNWSMVRIGTTAAQKKLFYRLKKEQEKFEREGLPIQPKAIAMNLNVDESDVKLMQERMSGKDLSLSTPVDSENESYTAASRLADPGILASAHIENQEQAELFKKALDEFVDELDERERMIFHERLLSEKPKTLLEIGEQYGFTKERARQLEERIKEKLKVFLSTYYPDISMG